MGLVLLRTGCACFACRALGGLLDPLLPGDRSLLLDPGDLLPLRTRCSCLACRALGTCWACCSLGTGLSSWTLGTYCSLRTDCSCFACRALGTCWARCSLRTGCPVSPCGPGYPGKPCGPRGPGGPIGPGLPPQQQPGHLTNPFLPLRSSKHISRLLSDSISVKNKSSFSFCYYRICTRSPFCVHLYRSERITPVYQPSFTNDQLYNISINAAIRVSICPLSAVE